MTIPPYLARASAALSLSLVLGDAYRARKTQLVERWLETVDANSKQGGLERSAAGHQRETFHN